MDDVTARQLIDIAKKACEHSYSPYSGLCVGSATLWSSGNVYAGCNVENASYGLTICAERTTMVKAVSEGERSLYAIAVVSNSNDIIRPCGACLQFIREFSANSDEVFIVASGSGIEYDVHSLSDYLPLAFKLKNKIKPTD